MLVFVARLTAKYPELTTTDNTPWASGPLAGEISALIRIGSHAMRLKTHPLPQMNGAVGTKLSALLLNAHMSGRCPSDKLLDGLLDALLHITA